ncbi:MAG: hypothetical protein FWG91_02885 [Lachnospiraceae bacterium]|nr:hypothetical protein [Lachnospiraceae bacterium]
MIRTKTVTMNSIKGIAYRQKLKAGGSGLTILTEENKAVVTINKRDGSYAPYGQFNRAIFTDEVFEEAYELSKGLAYRRLGPASYAESLKAPEKEELKAETKIDEDESENDIATVCSREYDAIIEAYTDKNGSFSYELMNKDFIQRAHKSDQVGNFINEGKSVDEIIAFLVINKVNSLIRDTVGKYSNDDALALVKMLDDMNMRSAFKELKLWLRGKK